MKKKFFISTIVAFMAICLMPFMSSCDKDIPLPDEEPLIESRETVKSAQTNGTVFLLIDEESIDNGNEPNDFSEKQVNDDIADIGQRSTLRYFKNNVGKEITLFSGEVGDEGWFALKTIPGSWKKAGPTSNGLRNYLAPGPRLGATKPDDDREVLLDKIPNVTPLRAKGLAMLRGQTILAVVYDSDISINYGPLNGNLQGDNLGLVALKVLDVRRRTDGSSSSLPKIRVRIMDVGKARKKPLLLFSNAPVPKSSSEPFDIKPPSKPPKIKLTLAP